MKLTQVKLRSKRPKNASKFVNRSSLLMLTIKASWLNVSTVSGKARKGLERREVSSFLGFPKNIFCYQNTHPQQTKRRALRTAGRRRVRLDLSDLSRSMEHLTLELDDDRCAQEGVTYKIFFKLFFLRHKIPKFRSTDTS